jgi:hypothetical protein
MGLGWLVGWSMASCAKSADGGESGLGGSSSTSTSHTGGSDTGGGGGVGGGVAGQGGSAGGGGENGGAGGAACADFGEPCSECELAQCHEVYCACFESTDCVAVATCLLGCPVNDQACFQSCWTANPNGISDAALVQHCGATSCAGACTNLVPLSPCQLCLAQSCESEMNACMALASCTSLLQCAEACTTQQCQDQCVAAYPSGAVLGAAVIACGNQSCAAECAVSG